MSQLRNGVKSTGKRERKKLWHMIWVMWRRRKMLESKEDRWKVSLERKKRYVS